MSGMFGSKNSAGARRKGRATVPVPRRPGVLPVSWDAVTWEGEAARPATARHRWIVGSQAAVAASLAAAPRTLGVVPGHARLRGPFTASAGLVRGIAADVLANHADLARTYGADMLFAAPDLGWLLGGKAPAGNPPREQARATAEALAALTLAYAGAAGPQSLAVLDVDALDATDAAWLTALLRHADPARLDIVVASRTEHIAGELGGVIAAHATRTYVACPRVRPALGATPPSPRSLARAHIASDCLSDDPAELAAYRALDPAERAWMHDVRAARLELLGDSALRLGAIPFHRELGSDRDAAAAALSHAVTQCFKSGWHDAALAFSDRLQKLLGEGRSFPAAAGA